MFLFCGVSCTEAVYTLGNLPADGAKLDPCRGRGAAGKFVTESAGCSGDASGTGGASTTDAAEPDARGALGNDADVGFDATTQEPDGCVIQRSPATRRGLDVLLLVDASPSVALEPLWTNLTQAISGFVGDISNTGLGLGVEYYGLSCTPSDYTKPAVPIGLLPGTAAAIMKSYPLPLNGKAITPALEGAYAYVRGAAARLPDRDAVLLLMSDGILDPLCGSTEANALDEVTAAFTSKPVIKTYVVALGAGPTLIDPIDIANLTPLDDIAAAGGTMHAARVEVNSSTNTELTTALDGVAAAAAPCAFAIPAQADASRASMEWRPTKTAPTVVWPRVDDANGCDGTGVFVSSAAPRFLELCPASCDALMAHPTGDAWVRSGC
jgi:hypothetical protein